MKGNQAMAEAAIQAGCDAYFGYPITPQAEVLEWMAKRMPEEGRVFVQAESELAAINMALGASAAGARVLVSSSSPGISLMAEAMSYMAGSRLAFERNGIQLHQVLAPRTAESGESGYPLRPDFGV